MLLGTCKLFVFVQGNTALTELNEADRANTMLCLGDLLFINLRGMNLVKLIVLKDVLLWKMVR